MTTQINSNKRIVLSAWLMMTLCLGLVVAVEVEAKSGDPVAPVTKDTEAVAYTGANEYITLLDDLRELGRVAIAGKGSVVWAGTANANEYVTNLDQLRRLGQDVLHHHVISTREAGRIPH